MTGKACPCGPRGQAAFSRIASSSASAVRVCHPGPVAFQRAKASVGRRIEIDVRAVPDFGRPRGFNSRLAAGAPNSSGRTSLAGFAFANVAFVHPGFSTPFRDLVVLRFKVPDLAPTCPAKTDHLNAHSPRSRNQCVQSAIDQPQRLESPLTAVFTGVLDHKRAVPLKLLDQIERQTAIGNVPPVLTWIEVERYASLYIRIGARTAMNAAQRSSQGARAGRLCKPGSRERTGYRGSRLQNLP